MQDLVGVVRVGVVYHPAVVVLFQRGEVVLGAAALARQLPRPVGPVLCSRGTGPTLQIGENTSAPGPCDVTSHPGGFFAGGSPPVSCCRTQQAKLQARA